MNRKIWPFQVVYYFLTPLIYTGILFVCAELFHTTNLGAAMIVAYGILFLLTPIVVLALMRFSLLPWYLDPIAAAEVPLFLYFGMILKQMSRSDIGFYEAMMKINGQLLANGGEGMFFLVGLFLFGLAATFSFARKRGESISYRLLAKFFNVKPAA